MLQLSRYMYLQRIEIQGFKSFAEKTVLEFPRPDASCDLLDNNPSNNQSAIGTCGVVCVVGPNGSGKSNVVDAIRWVLGEQSLKSLRGKKSEDVIFQGSEKKSKLGMAYVALHINNADRTMPIDYEEVVISRRLYRNGESEYLINKNKVRLQDVLLLVAQSNFGQKSYSIVSQGSIDEVIMSTPGERKEYFDDAVGVKQFQIKRDQSINKLESAWNNLRQVDALLTEIEPRLNSLTRQVRRLERREQVEKELRIVQQRYYGFLWHNLEQQLLGVKPKLQAKEQALTGFAESVKKVQQQFASLEKQDTRSHAFTELQQKYQAIMDEKNKLREEQLMLQNKIELTKQRIIEKIAPLPLPDIIVKLKEIDELQQRLSKSLDEASPAALAQARQDAKDLVAAMRALLGQLENPSIKQKAAAEVDPALLEDLKAVEADMAGLEQRLQIARRDMEDFNKSEEQKKGEFFALQRQLTEAQNQYNQCAQEASQLRVDAARLETRQQDLRREMSDEMKTLDWLAGYVFEQIAEAEVKEELFKLKRQLELIGGVDPEVVEEYKKVKERYDFLSGQAEDLRSSITSLEHVINDLDDKIQVRFDVAFKNINREFSKFFNVLFGGGKAELQLLKEDELAQQAEITPLPEGAEEGAAQQDATLLDKLTAAEESLSPKKFLRKRIGKVITGIEITATPPGKKVSSITMLSGGERSLTAIALLCAVIANNPSPFVILDEVDAALDEANSQRFSRIIGELSHKTQFIVITHNRATMHVASILYGVTMGDDGISKLISLKFEEAARIVRN